MKKSALLSRNLILFCLLEAFTISHPFAQSTGFRVAKVFHIASSGGWDYIAVGPDNNRLYVSHGTQVNILNETTGDSVGVILNTIGVHGIAFVPSLARVIPVMAA